MSVLGLLILVGGLCITWHFDREGFFSRLVFLPVLIGWILYRQLKNERDKWESLVIEFRDGKLIRRLDKYPVLEVAPNEVKAIRESPRAIIIETNNHLKRLIVPSGLTKYDEFRDQLISWAPAAKVAVWPLPFWEYIRNFCGVLASICVFVGPLYLIYTPRRDVILPLGVVLSLSMLAIILYTRNSPDIPLRGRKSIWFLVLLPILVMLARLLRE